MVFHWLGWLALACCLPLAVKLFGRDFWRRLRQRGGGSIIHKRLGIIMLALAGFHCILLLVGGKGLTPAGLSGILALLCGILVALCYACRKSLRAKWLSLHRKGTVLFAVMLVVHLLIAFNI